MLRLRRTGRFRPQGTHAARAGTAGAALVVLAGSLLVTAATSPDAEAFGTIPGREHSNITRAALGCPQSGTDHDYCFDRASLTVLAGGGGIQTNPDFWGAVGWPDNFLKPGGADGQEAHCDNADYLDPAYNGETAYPQTRDQASNTLLSCIQHAREGFQAAVDDAANLLDTDNHLKTGPEFDQAKRKVLYDWGRLLHAVQDFYSHSNWADVSDPGAAVGLDNAPGLNMTKPALLFNFLGPQPTLDSVPHDLSTGCYPNSQCAGRVRHGAPFNGDDHGLNKDDGKVDPKTGQTSEPGKYRGKIGQNFGHAVQDAVTDSRLQWVDLRQGLANRYTGPGQAWLMACGLTRDNPQTDCARAAAQGPAVQPSGAHTANDPQCGAHWQQPGGRYTTVFMQYVNCSGTEQTLAPYASGVSETESRYTFGRLCRTLAPGAVTTWVIDPSYFPPEDTYIQTVTHCWNPVPAAAKSALSEAAPAPGGARTGPPSAHRPVADPVCGTQWSQPGGSGTTVTMDYLNCTGVPVLIAPLAVGDGPDSRYSYTALTQYVPAGRARGAGFRIDPPIFPPEPTNIQWTTRVM
ncbi:hypothetical protein ACFXKR_38345 [Streptomyces violascens]|uniref:hypothetical protein n=1 Tax=Streptomyces violascens TaxID=67381 RepID=UPI0036B329AE